MIQKSRLLERLRCNILFENISDEDFEVVQGKLIEGHYRANEVILQDEGVGEKLFLLVDGSVKIVKDLLNNEEIVLALLHHGDCFGELELIDGRPRSSKVVAVKDCITYELKKSDFERLIGLNHPFTVRLLQLLSVRLRSLNLHFARELLRTSKHSTAELGKLHQLIEAAKIVNSTLDLDKLLTVILETALHVVGADRGTLYLLDNAKQELWSKVLKGDQLIEIRLPLGRGISGYVAATGDTLNIEDAYLDPRFDRDFDARTGYRTKTILCMPMRDKEKKIIGVFQLLNKYNGTFTSDDENFIDALSVHGSIAIENARLYDQEREKIAMEKDLRAAHEVQMSLLPQTPPHLKGYDIAGRTTPARMVGGDYFDFIPIDKKEMVFCLGDVSGKGLPASLLMAKLQATLRGQIIVDGSPRVWVRNSNRLLHESTTPEKFMTLFFGYLDSGRNTVCYCNAGHDHPYFFSADKEPRRLKEGGIILSVMDDYPYQEETLPLNVGDVLVVYSDGITEALNDRRQQFSEKRLLKVLQKNRSKTAAEIINAIFEAAQRHMLAYPQYDDMTAIVIKRVE